MSNNNPTPESDAFAEAPAPINGNGQPDWPACCEQWANFARTLERQRDTAIEEAKEAKQFALDLELKLRSEFRAEVERLTRERDQLRSQLEASRAECARFNAEIEAIQKHIRAAIDSDEAFEGGAPAECVALIASQRDNAWAECERLRRDKEQALVHLGNKLDEVWTTKRGDWPRDLFCAECGCNVSQQKPHKDNCHLGQAIAFWDSMQPASGEEGL